MFRLTRKGREFVWTLEANTAMQMGFVRSQSRNKNTPIGLAAEWRSKQSTQFHQSNERVLEEVKRGLSVLYHAE